MELPAAIKLAVTNASAEVYGLASGTPIEVRVGRGDELKLEYFDPLIEAADQGDHELHIQLLQQNL
jgi:hypothetical protein